MQDESGLRVRRVGPLSPPVPGLANPTRYLIRHSRARLVASYWLGLHTSGYKAGFFGDNGESHLIEGGKLHGLRQRRDRRVMGIVGHILR
jgi:hypothetical protein